MLAAALTLAGTTGDVPTFIRGAGGSTLPAIDTVGGSVHRVTGQLDMARQEAGA